MPKHNLLRKIPKTINEFSKAELEGLIVWNGLSPVEIDHLLVCDCTCACAICYKHSQLLKAHLLERAKLYKQLERKGTYVPEVVRTLSLA